MTHTAALARALAIVLVLALVVILIGTRRDPRDPECPPDLVPGGPPVLEPEVSRALARRRVARLQPQRIFAG